MGELNSAIAEVNEAVNKVFPGWVRIAPFMLLTAGLIMLLIFFTAGHNLAFSVSGDCLCGAGFLYWFWQLFCGFEKAVSTTRAKLAELSARYASRKIDFQLQPPPSIAPPAWG